MKNKIIFPFLLLIHFIHSEEKQMPEAQKAEMVDAEQSTQPSSPAFNLNFTVATSNAQDSRAQNTTSATSAQAQTSTQPGLPPQIIIVKHEHQQESMARGIFLTLLSAGLHAGVAIFTGGKASIPTPAKPAILPFASRLPIGSSPHMQRIMQAIRNG